MCDPQTFQMTAAQYATLQAKALSAGLHFNGDGGETSQHGCVIQWKYDVAEGELTVTCLSKPFYLSCDMVNEKLRELIEQ